MDGAALLPQWGQLISQYPQVRRPISYMHECMSTHAHTETCCLLWFRISHSCRIAWLPNAAFVDAAPARRAVPPHAEHGPQQQLPRALPGPARLQRAVPHPCARLSMHVLRKMHWSFMHNSAPWPSIAHPSIALTSCSESLP